MKDKAVITGEDYSRIDGRNAYSSHIKKLTLGNPILEENKNMEIGLQLWKETSEGELLLSQELPIHQVMDLMIFLGRTMVYFKEAYRYPLMYDEKNPVVDRIGLQGDAMTVKVCTENPQIDDDIASFSQALNNLGEITGERLRVLKKIMEELSLY